MSWDNIWEEKFKSSRWGEYPESDLIRFMARYFYNRDRASVSVLEVGCGPGPNIWYLCREGFSTKGIDGSSSGIERARKRLQLEGLEAKLTVGDIINLPYKDDSFDAVIDSKCIYCNSLENTHKILSEIKRVLKPGGYFYSTVFSDETYLGENQTQVAENEYTNISDGVLKGMGFARLINIEGIHQLYGQYLNITSIDKIDYTRNDRKDQYHEFSIICQK